MNGEVLGWIIAGSLFSGYLVGLFIPILIYEGKKAFGEEKHRQRMELFDKIIKLERIKQGWKD